MKDINNILFHTKCFFQAKIFRCFFKWPYGEHSHSLEEETTETDPGFIQ